MSTFKAFLLGGMGVIIAPEPLQAQQSEDRDASASDIIVTATRSEQRLSDVPISLAAIGQDDLDRYGAQDVTALLGRVAGLSIETGQPGFTRFVIRGVNAGGQFGWRQGAATAIYIDESPLTTRTNFFFASPDINLFDMARVEVLRGPQGTLYGASAIGGAIRAIPNAPDAGAFAAVVDGELSGTQDAGDPNHALRGAINLPLIANRLALRLVADHVSNAGFIDAILIDSQDFIAEAATAPRIADYNSRNRLTLRAALGWTPNDRVRIEPAVTWQLNRADGAGDFALNSFGTRDRATVFASTPPSNGTDAPTSSCVTNCCCCP